MRFGLFGGALRTRPGEPGYGGIYDRFVDKVVEAEQLGFEAVFLVEHHFTGRGDISASLSVLSHMAGRTSTMRLGTAVTVLPWHVPLLLAEQAATVDVLSHGRLDFGVGRGYRPNEFHGFEIDPAEASARFDECLDILKKAWTTEGRFSHDGDYWHFRDVVVEPQPIQRPYPPIWVAGSSEGTVKTAAARGYRLLLDQFGTVERTAQRVAWFREGCETVGRPFDPEHVALTRGLLLLESDDPAEREEAITRRIHAIGQLRDSSRIPGQAAPPIEEHAFYDDSRESSESAAILGPPDECIARLQELRDVGIETVLFGDYSPDAENLRRFAKEVMPALQ